MTKLTKPQRRELFGPRVRPYLVWSAWGPRVWRSSDRGHWGWIHLAQAPWDLSAQPQLRVCHQNARWRQNQSVFSQFRFGAALQVWPVTNCAMCHVCLFLGDLKQTKKALRQWAYHTWQNPAARMTTWKFEREVMRSPRWWVGTAVRRFPLLTSVMATPSWSTSDQTTAGPARGSGPNTSWSVTPSTPSLRGSSVHPSSQTLIQQVETAFTKLLRFGL